MVEDLCGIDRIAMNSKPIMCKSNCSYKEVHGALAYGFQLSWRVINCERCKGRSFCWLDDMLSWKVAAQDTAVSIVSIFYFFFFSFTFFRTYSDLSSWIRIINKIK